MIEKFKNILIVRTDNIGDAVLTLPLINNIRDAFPNSKITILAKNYTREIYENVESVDKVIEYNSKMNLVNFIKLAVNIKKENFELAFLVYPRFLTALILFLAGIKKRVGSAYRWYSFLLNEKIYEHRKNSIKHEVEYNLSLLDKVYKQNNNKINFGLKTSNFEKQKINKLLKSKKIGKFIIIHPTSRGSSKMWSINNFKLLAEKIINELKINIIITGTKKEEFFLKSNFKNNKIEILTDLKLMELAALIEKANCFISNSTGPLHIASVLGTRIVSFFSPLKNTSPTRWGPITKRKKIFIASTDLCPTCKNGVCNGNECMEQFDVNSVFVAVKENINEK